MKTRPLSEYEGDIFPGQVVKFPVLYIYNNNGPRKPKTVEYKGRVKYVKEGLAVIEGIEVPGLYNRPLDQLVVVGAN